METGSGWRVEFEEICEEEVSGRVIHGEKGDLLEEGRGKGEGGIFFFFFVGEMWLLMEEVLFIERDLERKWFCKEKKMTKGSGWWRVGERLCLCVCVYI